MAVSGFQSGAESSRGPSAVGSGSHRYLIREDLTRRALASLRNRCMIAALSHVYRGPGLNVGHKGQFVDILLRQQLEAGRGFDLSANNNNKKTSTLVERTARLKVQEPFHVHIENLERVDLTVNLSPARLRNFYRDIGTTLAIAIDMAMAREMVTNIGHYVGDPDSLISTTLFHRARSQLRSVPLPPSHHLYAVVDPLDVSNMATSLVGPVANYGNAAAYAANKGVAGSLGAQSGSTRMAGDPMAMTPLSVQDAYQGSVYGIPFFESLHIPPYEPGTWGNATAPKFDASGNNATTGNSIVVKGLTAGDVFKAGMLFEIAGVNQVNLRSKQKIRPASFTLTEDVTVAAGATTATWKISPEINAGAMSYARAGSNVTSTAYNNVDKAPVDDAVITIVGSSGGSYRQAILFEKMTLYRKDIPLSPVSSVGEEDRVFMMANEEVDRIGFNMRYMEDTNFTDPKRQIRVDTWCAFSVIEPWNACRVIGKAAQPDQAIIY